MSELLVNFAQLRYSEKRLLGSLNWYIQVIACTYHLYGPLIDELE